MASEDFRGMHGMGRTEILRQFHAGHTGLYGRPGLAPAPDSWKEPRFLCDGCDRWSRNEGHAIPGDGYTMRYCDACLIENCRRCSVCPKFRHVDDYTPEMLDGEAPLICPTCATKGA
jgi:hypothetical protein